MMGDLHLVVLMPAQDDGPPDRLGAELSSREREVLGLIADGLSGDAVAHSLCIAPETVRRHIANARRKLGATTRAHAVAVAMMRGLIRWPTERGDVVNGA